MAMVLQGVLIIFLFTLLHETVHRTPFRSLWLNRVVSIVCGFLVILPVEWFRSFHFEHHRYTNIPSKDPELQGLQPQTLRQFYLKASGLPVWWAQFSTLAINAFGDMNYAYVPKERHFALRREARVMLSCYGILIAMSVALNSVFLLYVWIIPIFLGQPFLRLYLMAEHTGCPHVENMLENTRTVFTHPMIRWLAWNMPYHVEHHCYPGVPYYKLPELHSLIHPHLKQTETGYPACVKKLVESCGRTT